MTNLRRFFVLLLLTLACFGLAQREDVYYEIFVRSFQDSDGDGVGDLQGVIGRLDYLEDLGVTGLWLMPIHPSPSYHGYDVTDYYAVNPDYGTLQDFETLLDEAHARGINIVMDLVVNHSSSQHPWFLASKDPTSPYRDYYLWRENNPGWLGLGGPAWHASGDDYYLGLFWSEMPDLNYRNPEVVEEMDDIATFWLELGVDGFRIDAIQHVIESTEGLTRNTPENLEWVEDFEAFIKTVNPDAFLVGETWTDTETIANYFTKANLDLAFDYPLYTSLLDAVGKGSATNLNFTLESEARLFPPDAKRAIFLSNHDQIRPATSLSLLRRDEGKLKLAAGLLLTLPGTPFLYYGEEIGLPNGPGDKDEEKRTPMRWDPDAPHTGFSTAEPWYPFSTDDPAITVAAQAGEEDSVLNTYKTFITLRQANPALSRGSVEVLDTGDRGVLAFARTTDEQTLLVIANLSKQEREVDVGALLEGSTLADSFTEATDLLTGETLSGTLVLTPLEVRVLE